MTTPMRKLRNYSIKPIETPGFHNAPLYIRFKLRSGKLGGGNHFHRIGAGRSDDIQVYETPTDVFILCINTHLPYVGLEHIDKEGELTGEATNVVFLQEGSVEEVLGEGWEKTSTPEMIRALMEYMQ